MTKGLGKKTKGLGGFVLGHPNPEHPFWASIGWGGRVNQIMARRRRFKEERQWRREEGL